MCTRCLVQVPDPREGVAKIGEGKKMKGVRMGKGKKMEKGRVGGKEMKKRPFPERANDIDKFPIRVMGERRREGGLLQKNEKGDVITNATYVESKKEYWENLMPINSTTKLKRKFPKKMPPRRENQKGTDKTHLKLQSFPSMKTPDLDSFNSEFFQVFIGEYQAYPSSFRELNKKKYIPIY